MSDETSKARVREILELRGRKVLDKAKKIMLEGVESGDLHDPLRHLSERWEDLYRPTLMALSCEAVGGNPEKTTSTAVAMTLLCSSMNVYDDIIDRSRFKRFLPTLSQKFGDGLALIVGGLVTAKAFNVLLEPDGDIPPPKRCMVNRLIQDFLLKMSKAEATNLELRRRGIIDHGEKLKVIMMQSVDFEALMKIGATVGCGSASQIERLGKYGSLLSTSMKLREDLKVALNLTVELADRIGSDAIPYALMWSLSHSPKAEDFLSGLKKKKRISSTDVQEVANIISKAGAVGHVRTLVEEQVDEAIQALSGVRHSEAKDSLILLIKDQLQFPKAIVADPGC